MGVKMILMGVKMIFTLPAKRSDIGRILGIVLSETFLWA